MSDSSILKRTIVKHDIPSKYLEGGSRHVRVYLPPGYQEILSYPVVYCQDGEDFFNFGRIATHANQLIIEDDMEPFIIVGVDVNKKIRTSEYAPDGERFDSYTRAFAEEIVPAIEQMYPVRTDWTEITLAGDSLGGTVSLHLALKYPNKFRQVISLSGAYYPYSQQLIAKEQDLSWLHLFMIVGLQETAFTTDTGTYNFVELNRNTHKLFTDRKAHVHYAEHDGHHLWGFWQKYVPDALRHFLD
ncbi:alpha/beta hydrolase-fold protein [Paenibacillus alvei]|uniref:alpha/beta hydrolase n=1 Tax=Paenibacillus alvei TaxID=44250 RepID=UPI000288F25F|nr:alpha/beta hydrolase-fold protein [Paenibacillus alvei]EJW15707.1 putative esterase [Paenibacillus alvei DSM 29]MCY9543580.1 alpha/beta hydrolase-fold protein [Paenibacillus alvei]MCY9707471.1 alpha/beta hydrolase-fold protein [Paenibacillus alvei]MCY9734127.1 alpha/beta hydrolase-fold protein [Paenibacillus alvei]MCY9756304.1 alpha/beta hydrolase-fold protein [Paenibacillus alvei]